MLLIFWCTDNSTFRLFTSRKVMVVQLVAERDLFRITDVAESGGAREHSLYTDFDKKVNKLGRDKAALRSDLTRTG